MSVFWCCTHTDVIWWVLNVQMLLLLLFSLLEDASIFLIRISCNVFVSEKLSCYFFFWSVKKIIIWVMKFLWNRSFLFELRAFHLVSQLSKIGEKLLCFNLFVVKNNFDIFIKSNLHSFTYVFSIWFASLSSKVITGLKTIFNLFFLKVEKKKKVEWLNLS